MYQTFGCVIVEKKKGFFLRDRVSKSISALGLKIKQKSSDISHLADYLTTNTLKDDQIIAAEYKDRFILLGHPLYFLMNKELSDTVQKTKRTIFHFSEHKNSREYGYKYYSDGTLCTHSICFGENFDVYQRDWFQNGIKLPQSIHRENALKKYALDRNIPFDLVTLLHISLPRKGMSSLLFHPIKQKWVYGKQIITVHPDGVVTSFQELAPQGHKRGQIVSIDPNLVKEGLLITWQGLFYEWHHRTIEELIGFRFDSPSQYPNDITCTKYELH
ncbi:hypothetical protein [Aquimarina pacifica]|uniref:hypothetical protein n=1 Tax=Aquimarina pacifica TaxID=1296415 RepID=UPI0004728ED4|nr:hypothetical protein [Aquimarina pacifica]